MNKLLSAREEINRIDSKMLELFKERMEAVKSVIEYKIANDLPIYDEGRENEIIRKNIALLNDSSLEEYYKIFYEGVLKSSKMYQKAIKEAKEI